MRKLTLIIILGSLWVNTYAQDEFDELGFKIGVKTSINASLMIGTELENPRPKFGYSAGPYVRTMGKDNWFFQQEIIASFRGSNFKNSDTGVVYSRIAAFYVDVVPLVGYTLNPDEDNQHQILLGPYGSYLALSSVFVAGQKVPFKSDLNLAPIDFGLAGYYQLSTSTVGFQVGAKLGLNDINEGIKFDNVNPLTGKGGSIANLSFEIGMIF